MSEELDRFMAEKVMGWGYKYKLAIDGEDISYYWLGTRAVLRCDEWHPTKDMNQAMMCLDQWLDDNTDVDRAYSLGRDSGEMYWVELEENNCRVCVITDKSAPLAICTAIRKGSE